MTLLQAVCGDLGKPQFGLSQSVWDDLTNRVDAVIHNVLIQSTGRTDKGKLLGLSAGAQLEGINCTHDISRLGKPQFGLSQSVWDDLTNRVDAVIHNGALVHWVLAVHASSQKPYARQVERSRSSASSSVFARTRATTPQFGLSQSVWDDLTNRVDAVIHNGALVHWVYPYAMIRSDSWT
jgi:thioester reductase-like protein